jgi:hypothetical protein
LPGGGGSECLSGRAATGAGHLPGDLSAIDYSSYGVCYGLEILCVAYLVSRSPWEDTAMFDKLLHHKLLTEGLEGEGVVTEQEVEAARGDSYVAVSFFIGVKGHVRFDDGTEAAFSSRFLDTSKVGDLVAGTIVPVRYNADRTHAVLDVPKLEAKKEARKKAAAEQDKRRQAREIAAADAALAKRNQGDRHPHGT